MCHTFSDSPFGVYSFFFFNTVATGLLDIDSSKICCTSLCFKSEPKKGRNKFLQLLMSNLRDGFLCFKSAGIATFEVGNCTQWSESDCSLSLVGSVAYNGPQLARTIFVVYKWYEFPAFFFGDFTKKYHRISPPTDPTTKKREQSFETAKLNLREFPTEPLETSTL